MLFRKKVKKKAGPIELTVDRESVCMGDDVTAPNEKIFPVAENETLSDVMEKICAYLPKMNDVVWSVDTGIKTEAYIVMETKNRYWYELCEQDKRFAETEIHYLHCRYFHTGRFLYRDQMSGERIEKYPECGELLDKVKCFMGEYFKEELKIKGRSVCIWGEWFGRPGDNFHQVKTVKWTEDSISIHFKGGESLYITDPEVVENKADRFVVRDASRVLWTWYLYGEKQVYRNLCVRQYRKNEEGLILRAEGKRRDVKEDNGVLFPAGKSCAVLIE